MSWRNAYASDRLVEAVNARWPNRSKISDGTIGDAAHASRSSDHNPFIKVDGVGVVRARDITADGVDAEWLAEHFRQLGKMGDPRIAGGGYVIWNRRIASERNNWAWRSYSGSNPHTHHVHLSFSRNQAGFDSNAPWAIVPHAPAPPPPPKGWLDMLSDKEQDDLYAKVKSIYRHTVEGPDPRKGSDRHDMTWPQRVTEALRVIQSKVE